MKIGILTFHDGLNHGAYLQAYATMRIIEQMGHKPIIINYKNREHWLQENVKPWMIYRRPIRFLDHIGKHRAFSRDRGKLNMTAYTRKPSKILSMNFDAVVVGSDVVWNYKVFGFDPLYFGKLPARLKIAYAPSFGWTNYGESIPDEVASGLKSFHHISARDINTAKIVESVTGKSPKLVLDPTLIHDFKDDELVTERIINLGKYALVYCYVSDPLAVRSITDFAKSRKLKLVSVGYRQPWCDKNLMDVGPMEWLNCFRYADHVVTSTFHGMIFSLKYQKTITYIHNDKAQNRIISLASATGINELAATNGQPVVQIKPNYSDVDSRLKPLIESSRVWLRHAINTQNPG